jgi:hypothetical protein
MNSSFIQRLLGAVFAGFVAACLLWFVRHIIERAIYENGAGWKDMYSKPKTEQKP